MRVVGVASQAQHGKDTLANRLQEKLNARAGNYDWERAAFARNVKRVFCETFGVSFIFVEEWKVKDEIPPGFDMPVRQALQFIGNGFRGIRSTIWLDLCFQEPAAKIISDVRYINELKRVKAEGGLNILVGRTAMLSDDPDGSEAEIRPFVEACLKTGLEWANLDSEGVRSLIPHDGLELFNLFVRNDGTKDEFYEKIDTIVVPYVENFYKED